MGPEKQTKTITCKHINLDCLKGAFAKGCFLAFEVLQWEAPFVLSRFSGAFVLSPVQE